MCPSFVHVVPVGNGESKSGGSARVLLHGAVDKAVGELEATGKGQRRADDLFLPFFKIMDL